MLTGLIGNGADNLLAGRAGDDQIDGRAGNDTLRGGAGDDVLRGQRGNDVMSGGGGDDLLRGNHGADDLRGIDVGSDQPSDQAFVWTGGAAFKADGTGQLRAQIRGADTILLMDHDGDGRADLAIRLTGLQGLDASDIML